MQKKIQNINIITTLEELAKKVDYSLIKKLNNDPKSTIDGIDHFSREVFSGHYVPVIPTPIKDPIYIAHSKNFFKEIGFCDSLSQKNDFMKMFSGDISSLPQPFKKTGWATGYALSIYGREYYQQCPFQTGNGYGDGRAISILEVLVDGKRWEMQLKGGGKTPYCRGADGRAVLRSSVREFLAQEHMHSLNIPTSRSLSLYGSQTETVQRPWFRDNSYSKDPEVMIEEFVAITTRVAPSFLRVGQIELFGRRARKNEHKKAKEELEMIVMHLIDREYSDVIDKNLPFEEQVVLLAYQFRDRLTALVANWIRVGYCQGNFNSDNCAAGGFTLDYGPFGFIDMFDPQYQPWTGGGVHFSFFNQPKAANLNFSMFCQSLELLVKSDQNRLQELNTIKNEFLEIMENELSHMWSKKLGLETFDEDLFYELIDLMIKTSVDYTIFFRELSNIPDDISDLYKSFYSNTTDNQLISKWSNWLSRWKERINITTSKSKETLSIKMKKVNPKYTLREWLLVPAYEEAQKGNYTLINELQEIMTNPYDEQSDQIEEKYYRKKPHQYFEIAGISHISCSS